jgi:hypothetical protein
MSGVGIRGVVLWVNFFCSSFYSWLQVLFFWFFGLGAAAFAFCSLVIAGGVFDASFVAS